MGHPLFALSFLHEDGAHLEKSRSYAFLAGCLFYEETQREHAASHIKSLTDHWPLARIWRNSSLTNSPRSSVLPKCLMDHFCKYLLLHKYILESIELAS